MTCDEEKLPDPETYLDFYEFCVPDNQAYLDEVIGILEPIGTDNYTSVKGSGGIIRCDTATEYLFYDIPKDASKDILCELTLLPYIERIGAGVLL